LPEAAISQRENKLFVGKAYWEKTVSSSQINSLIKAVKDERLTKMTKRNTDVVVAVAAAV
jgi:hypothetical protein